MVIDLLNKGVELKNLTKDELIERAFESYLSDIFSTHLPESDKATSGIARIGSVELVQLTPMNLKNSQIRDKLAEVLKTEPYKIEQYRADLIQYGLLFQYGTKQRVFPAQLGDYILHKVCFPISKRPSSFHENLLKEFLPHPPCQRH